MELNFAEIDNNNTLENSSTNYWDVNTNANANAQNKKKTKKKVSFGYDDILTSLNLVVSNNGALQYMTPNDSFNNNNNNNNTNQASTIYNPNVFSNGNPNMAPNVKKLGVDPQVKNSAIFNKYFKNYKDPNEVQQIRIPKTKEELRRMLIEQHIKRIQAQKRIAQIKPKQMFFGAAGTPMPIYTSQNQNSTNQLFKFK
jgi:hypothetical protein